MKIAQKSSDRKLSLHCSQSRHLNSGHSYRQELAGTFDREEVGDFGKVSLAESFPGHSLSGCAIFSKVADDNAQGPQGNGVACN
jgi:hypothetical protein